MQDDTILHRDDRDSTKNQLGRGVYILSIFTIILVCAAMSVFLFAGRFSNRPFLFAHGWQVVYENGGAIYIGHIKQIKDEKLYITEPIYFDQTKKRVETKATSTAFAVEPLHDWYTLVPIQELDKSTLTSDGILVLDKKDVLFYATIDRESQISYVADKLNLSKK